MEFLRTDLLYMCNFPYWRERKKHIWKKYTIYSMYIYWTIRDSRVMETAPPQRWMDRALCPPDGDSAKGEEKEGKKIAIFFLSRRKPKMQNQSTRSARHMRFELFFCIGGGPEFDAGENFGVTSNPFLFIRGNSCPLAVFSHH
jgi:hypothetical protein